MSRSDVNVAIGQRVAEARKRMGLKQADLAHVLGVAASNVSRLESGQYAWTAEQVLAAADLLSVPVETLYGRGGEGDETEQVLVSMIRAGDWSEALSIMSQMMRGWDAPPKKMTNAEMFDLLEKKGRPTG